MTSYDAYAVKVLRNPLIQMNSRLQTTIMTTKERKREVKRCFYLNNCIDRTRFLTEATVDALRHVDVIASCSTTSISPCLSFYRNGLISNTTWHQLFPKISESMIKLYNS